MGNRQAKTFIVAGLALAIALVLAVVLLRPSGDTPVRGGERTNQPGTAGIRVNANERPPRLPGGSNIGPANTDEPAPQDRPDALATPVDDEPTTPTIAVDDMPTTTVDGTRYWIGPDGNLIAMGDRNAHPGMEAGATAPGSENASDTADGTEAAGTESANDPPVKGDLTIAGFVLRGTEPVEGAQLSLIASEGGWSIGASTAANGNYSFDGIPAGTYTVYLSSPAAANSRRSVQLVEGRSSLREDFILPDVAPLKGRVVSTDGDRIAYARVEVLRNRATLGEVLAGEDGAFELFPLDAGRYDLRVSATGYRVKDHPVDVSEESASQDVIVELESAPRVEGVVTSPAGNVTGAYVALFSSNASLDPYASAGTLVSTEQGRFVFALPEDARTPLRAGAWREGLVAAYSAIYDPAQPPQSPLNVPLGNGASVKGVVLDSADQPVEGVAVTIKRGFVTTAAIYQRFNINFPSTTTDAEGRFSLQAIEPGETTLTFAVEGFVPAEKVLTLSAGENDAGTIKLESSDEAKEGRIFGLIVDEQARPLVNHDVYVQVPGTSNYGYTQTDARGGFRIDNLAAGTYTLTTNGSALRGDLYMTMDQTVPGVQPGAPQLLVTYDFGQSATMEVVDAAGEPVRSFRVTVRVDRRQGQSKHQQDYTYNFQTSDGIAVLEHLLAGYINVVVTAEGLGSVTIPETFVAVGQRLDLGKVTIEGGRRARGRVGAQQTGSPVSGAEVRAIHTGGDPNQSNAIVTTTNAAGEFELRGIPWDTVDLQISAPGFTVGLWPGNALPSTDQVNEFGPLIMEFAATLSGQVTDPQGRPLPNIRLRVQEKWLITNGEGRFFSNQISRGTFTVTIIDPSGTYAQETREVSVESSATLDVQMRPAAGAGAS